MSDQVYRFKVSIKDICAEIDTLIMGGATIDSIQYEGMTKSFFVSVTNVPPVPEYLLQENLDFLLLEDGFKILI
jgi:hypothetical protein